MLDSRTLSFIHSKCNSLHLPTPNSQSVPLPPLLPLGNTSLFSRQAILFICILPLWLVHPYLFFRLPLTIKCWSSLRFNPRLSLTSTPCSLLSCSHASPQLPLASIYWKLIKSHILPRSLLWASFIKLSGYHLHLEVLRPLAIPHTPKTISWFSTHFTLL